MSATKTKTGKKIENEFLNSTEVLTLGEAAAYLRIADAEVIRMVDQQASGG